MRTLSAEERLDIAVNLLTEHELSEYAERCERLENPELRCSCGYQDFTSPDDVQYSDGDTIVYHYYCPDCNATVSEYHELTRVEVTPDVS